MPEMAVQDGHTVPRRWYERWHEDPGLGARYRSITGERYMTMTSGDYSEIREGWGELSADKISIEPHLRWRSDDSDRSLGS
jgi:hypothetical protein